MTRISEFREIFHDVLFERGVKRSQSQFHDFMKGKKILAIGHRRVGLYHRESYGVSRGSGFCITGFLYHGDARSRALWVS